VATTSAENQVQETSEEPTRDGELEPQNDAQSAESDSTDELPDWARKSLKKANDEAASYRTQLRELQEQLKNAKSAEEHEAAIAALNARIVAQDRQLAAKTHGLPDDLVEFITAEDTEGIEAQAAKLAASLAPAREEPPAPPATEQPPSGARKKKSATSDLNPADAARLTLQRR
jgi:chromosome segregation ATPase